MLWVHDQRLTHNSKPVSLLFSISDSLKGNYMLWFLREEPQEYGRLYCTSKAGTGNKYEPPRWGIIKVKRKQIIMQHQISSDQWWELFPKERREQKRSAAGRWYMAAPIPCALCKSQSFSCFWIILSEPLSSIFVINTEWNDPVPCKDV